MEWYKSLIINYLNKNKAIKHFIKFCIVGLFSTLIDLSFYLFLERILEVYYLLAAGLAFVIASSFSFIFNRFWTFRIDHGQKRTQYFKFIIVASGGLILTELILYTLVDKFLYYDILAKLIAIIIVVNWNFILQKYWAFKKENKRNIENIKGNLDISIIIPVYNEEKVILKTISEVKEYIQSNFNTWEIIIIDDKSEDNSLNILQKIKDIKLLRNLRNHGKGYSIVKGVKEAKGSLILFMDADNSTRIKELDNFIKYTSNYDLIIGSRALKDSKINIILGNLLVRIFIYPKVYDSQCGFKLFNNKVKPLFSKLTIEDWGFDFELLFLAKEYNLNIKELPITWTNNTDSKVRGIDYLKTLLQVFKVRFNNLINKYK